MNLTFLDLLGTKKKWETGGRAAVEAVFARFERLVLDGFAALGAEGVLDGGIESDSAAFIFSDETKALRFTQTVFSAAFAAPGVENEANRLWIRGTIVPLLEPVPPRAATPMDAPFAHLSIHRYAPAFLQAISVERSGFKGMRILIAESLITEAVRAALRIPVGQRQLIPLRRLDHSDYRVEAFQDWLWMAVADDDAWARGLRQVATRLRWAAKDSEEFVQAAATQVVFNECEAIRASLRNRP